jgi:hypothetical protein
MEASGRGLIWGTIPKFAWRDWGKLRKSSVAIPGLRTETWTRDLPNTKQECSSYVRSLDIEGICESIEQAVTANLTTEILGVGLAFTVERLCC